MPEQKDKAHLIADDILRMLERGETADNLGAYPDFKEYLENNRYAAALLDDLSSAEGWRAPAGDKARDMKRLVTKLERRRRRRSLRIGAAVGAAAACIAFAVIALLPGKGPGVSELVRTAELNPVFIQSNGHRIVVDGTVGNVDLAELSAHIQEDEATEGDPAAFNHIIVPAGNMLTASLPDGSKVTLNAGSSLRYPTGFGNGSRNVELTGEAYFRVVKSDAPFRITTGDSRATVYGTEFNVDYQEGVQTEVVLVSGSVGFEAGGEEVMMKPGQMCRHAVGDEGITLADISVEDYTGWTRNEFKYNSIDIAELLRKLSGWYGVEFSYDPAKLAGIEIYIASSRDVPLDELLDLISDSSGLKFEVRAGKITANPKN